MKLIIILAAILNLTWAPDSSRCAYTRDNDLYVRTKAGEETRLTFDGSETILNGYASWVYYEEIFGRPSKYRAFWWSPDSRRLAFFRFDNSNVPVFPIYCADGQNGSLSLTRYPKAGQPNPEVKIGIVDLEAPGRVVWADFDSSQDQYFGTPFWSGDGSALFVQREPRRQNTLDLYRVDASDGSKKAIYHEEYKTWLDWIGGMLFAKDGLYMVRAFETGWEQIYFLSYDGKTFKRLSDGPNWRTKLVHRDARGNIYFTAQRDSRVKSALYCLSNKGKIKALTDTSYNVQNPVVLEDGTVKAKLSNCHTPSFDWNSKLGKPYGPAPEPGIPIPNIVSIPAEDGQPMFAKMTCPRDFDAGQRYPVVMEIYGGPDNAYVTDTWRKPRFNEQWFWENGFIHIVADVRVSGHTGRAGTDLAWRDLQTSPITDFVRWAQWLREQPYVDGEHIGVEGFSFGGTNTALLLLLHPDLFRCGIAGGGVYDWRLYDSHYTERFMDVPSENPEGYAHMVISQVGAFPDDCKSVLRLTHGTGDDNVHWQNTLQLVKELQLQGKHFELMVYPDGMHGYRGKQGEHSLKEDRFFWQKHLKE